MRFVEKTRKMTRNDDMTMTTTTCRSYIIAQAKTLNRAFTYSDLSGPFAYGTLRNTMSELREDGKILKLPEENPARFILPTWANRPEYLCVQKSDKKGMGVRFDFLSFLEGLDWDPVLSIHALKLSFAVYSLRWLGDGWEYCRRSHSYRRRFDLSHPVNVQCFDTGTVLVSVRASARPFHLDFDGILSLTSLLGEVKARLRTPCIPEPSTWFVVQWHLNRDSEVISASGLSFHVTFRDFFNNVARLYFKHRLSKVRAETIQSPKRSLKDAFEKIMNREMM